MSTIPPGPGSKRLSMPKPAPWTIGTGISWLASNAPAGLWMQRAWGRQRQPEIGRRTLKAEMFPDLLTPVSQAARGSRSSAFRTERSERQHPERGT